MSEGKACIVEDPLTPGLIRFADLLARRFERHVFTTEDAVRYTMFHAFVETLHLEPEDIVLEKDHGSIARAKIDTWIHVFAGRSYAFEFKYDRGIPSQMNSPLPQKAGQAFKDIFRLARLQQESVTAVFVYLASREMAAQVHGMLLVTRDTKEVPQGGPGVRVPYTVFG